MYVRTKRIGKSPVTELSATGHQSSAVGSVSQDLPLYALQTTFDLGKSEATRYLYCSTVSYFSHAINEVQHSLLSVLYTHRGAAYKNNDEYERVLEDTNRAIILSPKIPDGYLQAADVYQLQEQVGKTFTTSTT